MSYAPIDMSAFPSEREEGLKGVTRYGLFEVALYRSNLWQHSHRVLWILESVLPTVQKHMRLDAEMARALGFVHDDAEIVTGDLQAGVRARMSDAERAAYDKKEEEAIEVLASKWPKTVNGYEYRALLRHMVHKDCPEALLVMFADKMDAYCESLHEVYAGNLSLVTSVIFYARTVARYPSQYPELKSFLLSKEHPFVQDFVPLPQRGRVGVPEFELFNKPHTVESLAVSSRFPFYDEWKRMVIARGGEEGVRWLTEVKESVQ